MSNYTIAKDASEIGGHYRIGMTITPLDPDSYQPTNLTLRGPGSNVLAVTDAEPWPYDSSDVKMWFEPLVQDFGDITCAAEIHSAFQTLADPRVVLKNVRINGILDNGQLTFASGTPAESPTVTGDEVRLSQLLQYQVWTGAAVNIKIYFFAGPDISDTTSYVTRTVFSGIVQNITDINPDTITLQLTQPTAAEDTLIPLRRVTDPPDPNAKGQFVPIVYGEHNSEYNVNGLNWFDAIAAGFHPALAPVLSWKRVGGAGSISYSLVTNDCAGINTGWEEQDGFSSGLKSNADDGLVVYFPEADAWGKIVEGTSEGQCRIWSDIDGSGGSSEIEVLTVGYQTADVYVPCDGVYTDADGIVADPGALFDRNPFTSTEVALDTDEAVAQFTISPISIMGEIPLVADCIGAYLVLEQHGVYSGTPLVHFGIYSIPSADWVGGYAASTYGIMSETQLRTSLLWTQAALNSAAIPTSAYIQPDGRGQQPIMRMNWRYVHNSDPPTEGPMVVRIWVKTAGAAGEYFSLISCGVICRVKLKTGGDILTRTSPTMNITGRYKYPGGYR